MAEITPMVMPSVYWLSKLSSGTKKNNPASEINARMIVHGSKRVFKTSGSKIADITGYVNKASMPTATEDSRKA